MHRGGYSVPAQVSLKRSRSSGAPAPNQCHSVLNQPELNNCLTIPPVECYIVALGTECSHVVSARFEQGLRAKNVAIQQMCAGSESALFGVTVVASEDDGIVSYAHGFRERPCNH